MRQIVLRSMQILFVFIHGRGSQSDWTWGCVALNDKDIRELFDAVPIGKPVTIEH